MTPAEKRIKELLDRWLTSIELHLQYLNLPDAAYWKVQPWPKHDRPTRWVLESAKQKANELKEVFESRHAMGDSKFAEALELMNFLANLVGAQHVDRFVPLADAKEESAMPTKPAPTPAASPTPSPSPSTSPSPSPSPSRSTISPPPAPPTSDVPSWYIQATQKAEPAIRPAVSKPAPVSVTPVATPEPPRRPKDDSDATREMPKFAGKPQATSASTPAPAPKNEPRKPAPAKPAGPAKQAAGKSAPAAPTAIQQTVINDAVRLIGWGRAWHELAESIARMADRPPMGEVRKILRTYRPTIEKAAKDAKT